MIVKNVEGDYGSQKLMCTCPICHKRFKRAIEHVYKTEGKQPICSYTCYMSYHRQLKKKFMERHGDEFK